MKVLALFALVLLPACISTPISCPLGSWQVLETIPPDLNFSLSAGSDTHFNGFMKALAPAKDMVDIAALWCQLDVPSYAQDEPDTWHGPVLNQTFYNLSHAGVGFDLVTNDCTLPHHMFTCNDTLMWKQRGIMNVTLDNWSKLVSETEQAWGVLHAKVVVVDNKHAYSGSANLAYSSFSQTKELGLMVSDCPDLAAEYTKVVQMWKLAGEQGAVPSQWPSSLLPSYNVDNPVTVKLKNPFRTLEALTMFPCYSPPPFNYAPGSDCADVLEALIGKAQRFINISLMDYSPITLYQHMGGYPEQYWGRLDDALRGAASRGVQVNLLVANWTMTFASEQPYWYSLNKLPNVSVRQFRFPAAPWGAKALSRVNHDKYMVTDDAAYVGTSNWSGDYFKYFAGLGWTVRGGTIGATLSEVFERDWNSAFVYPLF